MHVNLMRSEENCPEPVRHRTPFQGAGRTLGSGSSNSSVNELANTATASISTPSSSTGLAVDESKPSTTIQPRLVDDPSKTIEEAGFANSVVIQKL
ncbi:hypothetical protein OPV22_014541 [Ensete ventricosum]|uniref:Uncharacterized protein n=1 Tax=Ensete ventricosum TaxID=4639 RepID=A0AAV8RAV0_ENSVE|nr:hypothetical protein OPV22_014541 [Ensete ventricosum]